MYIMSYYTKRVVSRVYREEIRKANLGMRMLLRQGRKLILRPAARMDDRAQRYLEELVRHNHTMRVVYEFSQRLQLLWCDKNASRESLLQTLKTWCEQAEATGIEALQEFARGMRTYSLQRV
jgi:hypothetical protein